MRTLIILALGLVVATASTSASRIVGGSVTSIGQYPFATALLSSFSGTGSFQQSCGGTIINNRSVLTAAHCFNFYSNTYQWRIRVGSTNYNSGGVLVTVNSFIRHSSYNSATAENDIAIIRINGAFNFNNNVRAAQVAGYNPPDNAPVWVIGWGSLGSGGASSIQLRHAQVYVVNQAICRDRYGELSGRRITDSMLCTGVLDVGGRDACQGDSGGPVLHSNIVVGITSWGRGCAQPRFPGVNVRVSRYTSWIQSNS